MLNLQNYSVLCSGHMEPSEIGIFLNKSWRPQLRDQTLCFSAWDGFFSAAATKGWAWCSHTAEQVERAAALGNFKLLVRSGHLDFTKGRDSLDKDVEKISLRQCHVLRTWAAERPAAPLPKAQSWHIAIFDMANGKKHLGDPNSMTMKYNRIFNKGIESQEPASARQWMFGIPKRNSGNGSSNKHVEQISFRQCVSFCQHRPAARLAAPLPTPGLLNSPETKMINGIMLAVFPCPFVQVSLWRCNLETTDWIVVPGAWVQNPPNADGCTPVAFWRLGFGKVKALLHKPRHQHLLVGDPY